MLFETLRAVLIGGQDWTFAEDGLMKKRQMSGNDVRITHEQRWFTEDVADVNTVDIPYESFI